MRCIKRSSTTRRFHLLIPIQRTSHRRSPRSPLCQHNNEKRRCDDRHMKRTTNTKLSACTVTLRFHELLGFPSLQRVLPTISDNCTVRTLCCCSWTRNDCARRCTRKSTASESGKTTVSVVMMLLVGYQQKEKTQQNQQKDVPWCRDTLPNQTMRVS